MTYVRPDIAAMTGYVPGEQPQAGKFIKLNTNENPYPPSPAAIQAIQHVAADGLRKYPDPVATAFRNRAAEVLDVEPDWILCGNGSDDMLTIATRAFVGQGQKLRAPHPSYVLYQTLAEIQGAVSDVVVFNTDWSLPPSFSEPAADLKIAFLANPNSPSGTCVAPEVILGIVTQLDCPLLVDEAYVDFADTNCLDLVRDSDKILVTRSLSKSYALAGLRFGFVVAQPRIINQLHKVKDSYNCDALAIAAATAAIDDQSWLIANRVKILATRRRFAKRLGELGLQVQPSQANFLWCTDDRPLRPVYEELKARRILVRYMSYDGWPEGLRISIGTDDQVDACLTELENILT